MIEHFMNIFQRALMAAGDEEARLVMKVTASVSG